MHQVHERVVVLWVADRDGGPAVDHLCRPRLPVVAPGVHLVLEPQIGLGPGQVLGQFIEQGPARNGGQDVEAVVAAHGIGQQRREEAGGFLPMQVADHALGAGARAGHLRLQRGEVALVLYCRIIALIFSRASASSFIKDSNSDGVSRFEVCEVSGLGFRKGVEAVSSCGAEVVFEVAMLLTKGRQG